MLAFTKEPYLHPYNFKNQNPILSLTSVTGGWEAGAGARRLRIQVTVTVNSIAEPAAVAIEVVVSCQKQTTVSFHAASGLSDRRLRRRGSANASDSESKACGERKTSS